MVSSCSSYRDSVIRRYLSLYPATVRHTQKKTFFVMVKASSTRFPNVSKINVKEQCVNTITQILPLSALIKLQTLFFN